LQRGSILNKSLIDDGAYVTAKGESQISLLIGLGGFIPACLSIWALLRVVYFSDSQIDMMTADLLTLAGVVGMPVFVFGAWMSVRRIGIASCRFAAVVFGGLGISAWPLSIYLSGFGA
jgi:hypothetical protein